jgi:hypothetical protein
MRWRILRTLLHKEVLRHVANRGGLALMVLLMAAAFLISLFGGKNAPGATLLGGVQHCYVDYWEDSPWMEHLRRHIPPEFKDHLTIRPVTQAAVFDGKIVYPAGHVAIQVRTVNNGKGKAQQVQLWNADADGSALAPFEAWFWRESHHYLQQQHAALSPLLGWAVPTLATVQEERSQLTGGADARSSLATSLVLFGLFFVCVYLLPSLTCEERERGVLLAQALSTASPLEILAARFLFYPVLGMALAALLAGIYSPAALTRPFFWLALVVAAFGSMGIGLTISTLAQSQRTASMGALCYMLAVAMLLVICQQNNIPGISWLALEYHFPRIFAAVLSDAVQWYHWWNLAGATVLSLLWVSTAAVLFRRFGWQ